MRHPLLAALLIASSPMAALAQPAAPAVVETVTHAHRPKAIAPTADTVSRLEPADGFVVNVFAKDLGHARMLAVAEDGTVYVTCPKQSRVMALRDRDGDGVAEDASVALEGLKDVHGIALGPGSMFLVGTKQLWRVDRPATGPLGTPALFGKELPDGGQHANRTLALAKDGAILVSVGSTCNACEESDDEHAVLLEVSRDGASRSVFAKGLRNTIGFAHHPETGALWGFDHGSDDRGDDIPPEELNLLEKGGDYGWPWAYGRKIVDPITNEPQSGPSKAERAARSRAPVLELPAHSAPIGMAFADGRLGDKWDDGAFVALHGSWNRHPPVGYEVRFVRFSDGLPTHAVPFLTGFLVEDGTAHLGRPAGVAIARDGSVLVSDDVHGIVYRVAPAAPVVDDGTEESDGG